MAKRRPARLMRMKQLTAEADVPKGTIQFYIREGLIPKPIKTHPNMAYYSEAHLDAIRLVKELQSKRFLPLSVIKRVMTGDRDALSVDEIRNLVEMDGKLFRNLNGNPQVRPLSLRALTQRTGVEAEDIRDLERLGVLHPVRKGKRKVFAEDDIWLVECWGRLRAAGFTRELGFDTGILKIHRDLMEVLVREEARILMNRVSGKVPVQDMTRMVEDASAILNTILGIIHRKLIVETVRGYTLEFRDRVAGQPRREASHV